MKYEMIFGDEKLFDGAPDDAVIAIKRPFISGVRSEEMYFFSSTFDAVMKAGSSFNFNNVILKTSEYAERRIIRTPTWTVEDQKAGRLPEIGAKLIYTETWDAFEFVGVTAGSMRWACKDFQDGFLYFFKQSEMSPIETPE